MWKYMNQEMCNQFLLSLHLIDGDLSDQEKIKLLYTISNTIENQYEIIKIKKNSGKLRTIYCPHPLLKSIQRKILHQILNHKSISSYAKAYHPHIGLKENALPHVHQKRILKLDIQDFFNHIQFINVYESCFSLAYFPKPIGMLLTQLCTYHDDLPQGAPTSAYISNLVMKDFDEEIGDWCLQRNISYTRYSDDMTFSGDLIPVDVIRKVKQYLNPLGLELNYQKIHVINHSQQQNVTGIVVNEKIQVPRLYRRKIRQTMHYIEAYGLQSHLEKIGYQKSPERYLNHIYGQVLYILQINAQDKEFQIYKDKLKEYENSYTFSV